MAHMDVLLCEDVDNLGQRGQVVRVRAGYGRNYLLPQGLAIAASAGNQRMIEEQKRLLAKREDRERVSAQGESEKLQGLELRFDRRVGEHGILYGSVTALDVAEALKEKGFTVDRRRIGLREHIKELGEYNVAIKLHREVNPVIKVVVHKEGEAEAAPVEAASSDDSAPAEAESVEASEVAVETPEEAVEASEEATEAPGEGA